MTKPQPENVSTIEDADRPSASSPRTLMPISMGPIAMLAIIAAALSSHSRGRSAVRAMVSPEETTGVRSTRAMATAAIRIRPVATAPYGRTRHR